MLFLITTKTLVAALVSASVFFAATLFLLKLLKDEAVPGLRVCEEQAHPGIGYPYSNQILRSIRV